MKAAVEHHFNGATGSLASYDSTKTLISSLLQQASGSGVENNYISTLPSAIVNIPEVFSSGHQAMPHIYKWSNNIYWIFTAPSANASTTRALALSEFNSTTKTITYRGFVTLSGTVLAGSKTIRSIRGCVYKHTTGTVSTSGASTTINGSSTQFTSERIAVGARIGFGTTDPTQVTTWYDISGITDDSTLTISAPVTLSAGTSYVIEEIRLVIAIQTTAAAGTTVTRALSESGVFLIKGLNYSTFTSGGTTIPEATTVDNIRASYLLSDPRFATAHTSTFTVTIATPGVFTINNHGLRNGDVVAFSTTGALPTGLTASATTAVTFYYVINATTNTFQVSATLNGVAVNTSGAQSGVHTIHTGARLNVMTLGLEDEVSKTDHTIYLCTSYTTAVSITKYNMRAALTVGAYASGATTYVASGVSPSAYVFSTTTQLVTGTPSQVNSGRIFTVASGPASGSASLFFATSTRIYRSPITTITDASTSYLPDVMLEVPPGSSTTYAALSAMSQVDYSSTIDRLFITNATNRFGTYITPYVTAGEQFEKYIGANLNRLKLTTTPGGASDGLFPQATLTIWTEDGWMFAIPNTATSGQNWLYIFPFGADAYYSSTSNQYVITPKLATPNATKLYSVYVDHMEYAGTYGLGFPVETYRLWYRTTGIDDNSGAWTEVPVGADLTTVSPGDYIQFKIAFDIMGEICVPTRIYSIAVLYEDSSQDSHYEPSLTKSSAQNRQFAWRQISSWGGTIPDLRIRLFNVANGATVLDDDITSSTYGDWEYSTDGGNTWLAWNTSADTIGNYIRYTADDGVIGNLITVRALLTQA